MHRDGKEFRFRGSPPPFRTALMSTAWLVLRNALFTIVVPGSVVVLLPSLVLEQAASFSLDGWRAAGLPFLLAGTGMYFWCLWHFAWTGDGTPAPTDPPKRLVARGPYRWVRNPMYLGVWSLLLGETIVFASRNLVVYLLVVALWQHLFVVLYEERTLARRFGVAYHDYCRSVPRWVPRAPS